MKYSTVRLPPLSSQEEKPRNKTSLSTISLERAEANFPLHTLASSPTTAAATSIPFVSGPPTIILTLPSAPRRLPICTVGRIVNRGVVPAENLWTVQFRVQHEICRELHGFVVKIGGGALVFVASWEGGGRGRGDDRG